MQDKRVPDAAGLTMEEERRGLGLGKEAGLLPQLDHSLHDLSQPITVLLCTLEYGVGVEVTSAAEMKLLMTGALEACGRLRETMHAMQGQVRAAMQREREERSASLNGSAGAAAGPDAEDHGLRKSFTIVT